MKRKFTLITAALALLACLAIPIGSWGQTRDTKTDVMFAKGFGSYTNNSFSAAGTDRSAVANSNDATGVTYAMQVFNGSTGAVRGNQSGASSNFSCRNTSTYDGYYISSVSLTITGTGTYSLDGGTTNRSVVYFGTSAFANPNTTAPTGTATDSDQNASGQTTLTWTNSDEDVSYFILYNLKTSGTCLSESSSTPLTVVWTQKSGGGTTTDPTITFEDGSVKVGKTLDLSTLFTSNSSGAVTYSITSGDSYASLDGSVITGVAEGPVTVKASQAQTAAYNAATATATITVSNPALSSIAITTPPTKTTYVAGETFDATGMVVTATYSDASTEDVTASCSWTPSGALTTSDTEITVSYTENAVEKTATQSITVNPYMQPTQFDIALNNTAFSCNTGNNAAEQSFTINNTVIVAGCTSSASSKTYYDSNHVRFYADSYLKITSPSGYKITKTVFTAGGTWNGSISVNTGTYNNSNKTWEGETEQLDFSFAAQNRIASIAITLALPSSVAAPTFSPDGGTYTTTQSVTINTTTDGATIYYTIDGTTPTSSSTEYSSPVSVSETMTIKAIAVLGSGESTVASATYTILPIIHDGTAEDPYTVADARNAIDVHNTVSDAYVSGIVSQVDSYNSTHQSITYWISDDGTTTNQLEVYSGKGIGGADFSGVSDIAVGATVVVKGNLKKYSSTYEFDYDNELVSYTAPTIPSVTPSAFLIEALATSGLSGTLTVTYANIDNVAAEVWFCNAAGDADATYDWIVANVNGENNVEYLIDANTGAARTAYFKVWAYDNDSNEVYSEVVTVTQAAPDFATLPFNWAGGTKAELNAEAGVTVTADNSDYAASNAPYRIKFNANGHNIVIKTNEQIGAVSVGIKKFAAGNTSVLKIEGSVDGTSYSEIQQFSITGSQNATFKYFTTAAFDADYRYVRIYLNKPNDGSNIGVGPIVVRGIESYNLSINGYTTQSNGWYLIAPPVLSVTPSVDNHILTPDYDLYAFDQSEANEWRNYKQNTFNLVSGHGYLYANSNNTVTLTFEGIPYVGDGQVSLAYDGGAELPGYNLIGNPYNTSATVNKEFYRMNDDHNGIIVDPVPANGTVAAMEGIFVVATEAGQSVTFTPASQNAPAPSNQLVMNLSYNTRGSAIDRAIVRFGEGNQLPKFQLFENSTKVYIPQGGKDYAIVRSEAQGELPINFKAEKNGSYTLSFEAENVEMNYLHLIDNLTGADIDLLQTPSYTFNGKTTDYASRFRLVFSANNVNDNQEGNTNFAYINGEEIVILNAEANATLQVVDLTGRIVSSTNVAHSVSTAGMVPGVYVLRLINGTDVKVQKIVVD